MVVVAVVMMMVMEGTRERTERIAGQGEQCTSVVVVMVVVVMMMIDDDDDEGYAGTQ